MGKLVAVMGGGMYAQYRCLPAMMCMALKEEHTAKDGASCFVNPLTALCFVETMRGEGHKAIVHTAAAIVAQAPAAPRPTTTTSASRSQRAPEPTRRGTAGRAAPLMCLPLSLPAHARADRAPMHRKGSQHIRPAA